MIKPNTFIIGAQKAATTSVYNWIAQHPNSCGPSSLKDFPFFVTEEYFAKGIESLQQEYINEGYNAQKVVLQGSVQYMFVEKAIYNIYQFNPDAKLICILRNPIERAISAYKYYKKVNKEKRSLHEALEGESDINDLDFDFTYKGHGLYFQQIEKIFDIFNKDQLLIIFYEDVSENPMLTVKRIFEFLDIDPSFSPKLKVFNQTGSIRFKFLQKIIFNQSKFKSYFVSRILNPILPIHKRAKIKLAFREWNTTKTSKTEESQDYKEERNYLKNYFKDEIINLESLLNKNLDHWKK